MAWLIAFIICLPVLFLFFGSFAIAVAVTFILFGIGLGLAAFIRALVSTGQKA
jgi:hypothetical protein